MNATIRNPRMIGIGPKAMATTLMTAEVKYLADPDAGFGEAFLQQEGVPHFSPMHLLERMGQEISGLSEKDIQRYHVPTFRAIFRAVCEEITATRSKRDEVVMGKSNSVSVEDLTLRLEAAQRVIRMIKHFSGK